MRTGLLKLTAPCSYLDIEKFQSWLEDMAKQGYLLSRRGHTRHTYLFHRISPLEARYRLTPVSDRLEDWNERPNTDSRTLSEAFGWEYVCTVGGFHIYRSYSEEDRELHSDPDILAESLRLLRRKAIFSALAVLIAPAVLVLLLGFLVGPGNIWRYLLRDGIMLYSGCGLLYLFITLKGIDRSVKLLKLRRLLKARRLPVQHRDWKTGEKRFRLSMTVTYIIGVMLILCVSAVRLSDRPSQTRQLPEDSSALPFVTLLDLAEMGDFESARRLDAGWLTHRSNPFARSSYECFEAVDVITADGTEGRFTMEVFCHEVGSGWLAARLTEEYCREAEKTGTPVDAPSPAGVELTRFFEDENGFTTAVLRVENTVIAVSFMRADLPGPRMNLNTWIELTVAKAGIS